MRKKLPLFVERVVAEAMATQIRSSQEHELQLGRNHVFSCRAGCSYCCHHPFLITIVEGLLLYRGLSSKGRWTPSLKKRVKEARDKTLGLAFDVWLLSNMPCPLLDENKLCSAYESRPLHCRTTFSNGNPAFCHPHELGEGTGLLPNVNVVSDFNGRVQTLLRRIKIPGPLMPLSEAVLIGEAIATGELSIEESALQLVKDMSK